MQHKIETLEDLNKDLAGRYSYLQPKQNRSSPEIDQDYENLMRDGYVIIKNLLSADQLAHIRSECESWLGKCGRNNFEGLRTQRIYDVLSKTRAIDQLADHPRVLGLVDKILMPNYLLSQVQAINILPDEDPQLLHMDDAIYPISRPRPPLGVATVWAIDDFTESNGATLLIAGSHRWAQERTGANDETIPAVMPAGAVVVFLASTWHGGGENQSSDARLGITCQYCQPYLRQQESFLLELSGDLVQGLSPELQSLVGYSITPPFFGMVDGQHPRRLLFKD